MQKIGLICAAAFEADKILNLLSRRRAIRSGGLDLQSGRLNKTSVILITSGVGKTNASHAATLLNSRFNPDIIINFGVGGAYHGSGLEPEDIAVAEREIYGDEGVLTRKGFRGIKSMGFALSTLHQTVQDAAHNQVAYDTVVEVYNEIPVRGELVEKALSILQSGSFNVRQGAFVTLSTVTGTDERAAELQRRYRPVCENMEGASVAHVCALYGTPFLELRAISNMVEKRDRRKWRLNEAAVQCQEAVIRIVNDWGKERAS